jgi:putative folate metabolism gamma-glutamate ligase
MIVTPVKTRKVLPNEITLSKFLDESINKLEENSVVAIAAKVVSICEGRVVGLESAKKEDLIQEEASLYLPPSINKYDVSFSITNNILIANAGIDESNGNDAYILWPKDPTGSANEIREHLRKKYSLKNLGVIITDSTTRPLQWGTTGIAIAYSGLRPLKDYIGSKDLFDREMQYQKASIINGLAAAAALVMGEGNEQTPLAIITDATFIEFHGKDPSTQELESLKIEPQDDLFAPFLTSADWLPGKKNKK